VPSTTKRFLGVDAGSDDRVLLALPAGDLKSGQIEAALEKRLDEIARHPLSGSAEAKRLAQQLESAADRLQAEIALVAKGPLHPAAARRAAKKLQSAGIGASNAGGTPSAPKPVQKPGVLAPDAVKRPGVGLSADDLTDFDRLALALLGEGHEGESDRDVRRLAVAQRRRARGRRAVVVGGVASATARRCAAANEDLSRCASGQRLMRTRGGRASRKQTVSRG
jgi:hypothetical protein